MALPDSIPLNPAMDRAAITDGRARFRQVLASVNAAHGPALPDPRKTEDILRDFGDEGAASGGAANLDTLPASVRVVAVPGFLTECVAFLADVLTDGLAHVKSLGCATTRARLDGRGGTAQNAKQLRDQIMVLPEGETVILLAMSKGVIDAQEMFMRYPETHGRVQALVALVGAVWGSPLAHMAPAWLKWFERAVPLPTCRTHGGAAVESLTPEVRQAFLQQYVPPPSVRTYTLGAAVEVDGMSAGMMSSYRALSHHGGLNDGQMLLADQALPGSEYLGVLNGDHIAVGMPFNRNPGAFAKWLSGKLLDHNAFPREVLVEAVVRRVLQDVPGEGM